MVITSRSLGARSVVMTDDVEGVEALAADIAFLANYAQTLPQAGISKVAAAGFSWDGMANVFAAARSSRIKALISLEKAVAVDKEQANAVARRWLNLFSEPAMPGELSVELYINFIKCNLLYIRRAKAEVLYKWQN
ncbi:hypothetical protein O0882_08910 [Janthinobacterium sp. SUN073]|uniref:hypothetical protein n=1 Tax=Janthinobacterium sp. SUN073 TaxID=3004102 RepID=UPI0025B1E9B0|nr:hypothetical protein [Janthinobacterium sp. SUN073]MDN2696436.1 hypothetical protein [Janthinobacterium sp. SUN073]